LHVPAFYTADVTKYGVLLHVYHLEVIDWNKVVWGDPARDQLGVLTKFADCLLDIPFGDDVVSIVYSGPSSKDGLSEGAYTRQYLVDRIDLLHEFPRLRQKLDRLTPAEYRQFVDRVRGLQVGHELRNTIDELESAGVYFATQKVDRVLQVAALNHAPRCIKLQGAAREKGLIPKDQPWFTVISEVPFAGSTAIAEQPHRPDDPIYGVLPALPESLGRLYYELDREHKIRAVRQIAQVIDKLAAEQSATQNPKTSVETV
jgi:hypothetical protein